MPTEGSTDREHTYSPLPDSSLWIKQWLKKNNNKDITEIKNK